MNDTLAVLGDEFCVLKRPNPLVIIGSGLAGYMLAKEFRKLNPMKPLTIITKSDGRFYSKPLLSTALTNHKTADMLAVASQEKMARELNAEILSKTEVLSIDRQRKKVLLRDSEIAYDKLILATGANKIDLNLGCNEWVHSVNDLEEYAECREWLKNKKHIVMMGAGLVGCEFTNDLVNGGFTIDIIAPETHPLPLLVPKIIGDQLKSALEKQGVNWHLGRFVKSIEPLDKKIKVVLDDGSSVTAEGVFSAVGLHPNVFLAEKSGLSVRSGVVVNRYLQTSDPHIYALGDCAEVEGQVQMYVAPLLQCARALAKILVGGADPVHYPPMPVVIKTPACPVVSAPIPVGAKGEWRVQGEGSHLQALFYGAQDRLLGFALVGDKVRDRMSLAKKLPLVFEV